MKLNEVNEIGFYRAINDDKSNFIFEVIENTDDNWLKDDPNAKLLVDEWGYEYTDTDDRKHYETFGTLIQVQYADEIEVEKINKKFIVSGKAGTHLTEDKTTYKEKINKINTLVKDFCNACKENESQKSKNKTNCLYCNYGKILKIINEE